MLFPNLASGVKKAKSAVSTAVNNAQKTPQSSGFAGMGSLISSGINKSVDAVKSAMPTQSNELMAPTESIVPTEPADPTAAYMEQLKKAQLDSRISSLDKAKTSALSALDTEQANVEPMYYDKRNQAAARSDVGAMNFAQYMASRGIKGNAGAMPEIYRNAGLQGQIGALDQQEAQNLSGIESQRANINTGYQSDVASANADVETQAMQNLIDQYNRNKEYGLQLGGLTGTIGGDRTLAGQQFDWNTSSSNPDIRATILANQARELENAAQQITNSFLPDTLKLEAQRLAQQVKSGSLDYETALANLNQIKAQTQNYNSLADNRDNPTTTTTHLTTEQKTQQANEIANKVVTYYQNSLPNNMASRGLGIDEYAKYLKYPDRAQAIIEDIGANEYRKLVAWADAQVKAAQAESSQTF